jgi:hypothetical protein
MYLFGIPIIALLVFGFFRLDQVFTSRKNQTPEAPLPSPDPKHEEVDAQRSGRPHLGQSITVQIRGAGNAAHVTSGL